MGDRVVLKAGDALTDDLGEAAYDLIMMFSLVHHFDEATNRQLVAKAARALRPGGYLVIGDALRPSAPGKGGQQGAFFDMYFALTSESGLWTFDEMRSWQVAAGLTPRKSMSLVPGGGFGLQVAEQGRERAGQGCRLTRLPIWHSQFERNRSSASGASGPMGGRTTVEVMTDARNVQAVPAGRVRQADPGHLLPER